MVLPKSKEMTFWDIVDNSIQEAVNASLERGLRVCPQAEQIMSAEVSYTPIANSIWKNTQDARQYAVCLSASDYKDDEQGNPRDWAYKVPRVLAHHLCMTCFPGWNELSFGRIDGTDFCLFLVTFKSY